MTGTTPLQDPTEALAARLTEAALGALDLVAVALGDRLGYYRALLERPGLTTDALAHRAGASARYTREWIEQQAATGLVVPDASGWRLADGAAPLLADRDDPRYLAPLARQVAAVAARLPAIADGARTGHGLGWADYGPEMRESQGEMNRPGFLGPLATDWLPAVPEVHARLASGARVADVGCGEGWSAIGIARGYPAVTVDGVDIDDASVASARRHVEEAGMADRVRVRLADVQDLPDGAYDVVTAFECVHDLPFPDAALRAIRTALAPDGVLLVADLRAEPEARFPSGATERLLYGFSIGVCLPDAMATPGSAQTGSLMRPDVLARLAREAGFSRLEEVPVDHDLWRFTVLRP